MPISGSSSYVPTTRDFLAHWEDANAALPEEAPLVLPKKTAGFATEVTRADLLALLEAPATGLIALRAKVEEKDNNLTTAAADLLLHKEPLLARLVEFNAHIRSWHEGSKWVPSLPAAPRITADESNFTRPMDDVAAQWAKMNAELTTPVLLNGSYTLANFNTHLEELRDLYAVWSIAGQEKRMAIQTRRAQEDRIYAILKKYREIVILRFPKDSPVYLSLPRLTPLPGHTPAAVILTGIWDAAEASAELGWTASTEPTLKHYQLRYCTGATYENDEEEILTTIPKTGPLTFVTQAGLSVPGATASYKVYVILESDNEKGSDPVAITRPE